MVTKKAKDSEKQVLVDPPKESAPQPAEAHDVDHDGHDDDTGRFVSPNPGRAGAAGLPMDDLGVEEGVVPPGVGNIVQFFRNPDDGPYAAMVSRTGESLGLHVFLPGSGVEYYADIPHKTERDADGPHWLWWYEGEPGTVVPVVQA